MTNLPDQTSAEAPRPEAVPDAPRPRKCKKCRSEIGQGKKKCDVCDALQENVQACRICKELIPFKAKYCNSCKSYQGVFRYVSFSQTTVALMAAVLALLVALAPHVDAFFHRQSDTSFTVTGADGDAIYVHLMNSGRKPSIIRACSLAIAGVAQPVTLEFLNKDTHDAKNVIRPASEGTVGLTASGVSVAPEDTTPVTLQMMIEESSDPKPKPKTETFPARRIHEFFAGKVPAGKL
ncbi:MAG TPA: hypothetical protein VHX14_16715 [Thermoanaerobaculia bacterium]|nr:hypothetical protein [Thermoanaerobaculia bacterium]